MANPLTATRELLHSSCTESNIEVLRQKFLACYNELETAKASLNEVVAEAFKGLDGNNLLVSLFHHTAGEIARRVDNGDDNTGEHAYHNALHFAKVVVNFRALAAIHNSLYPQESLSDEGISGGILAATAHDIRHNGRGNTVDGKHQQFRLEQLAIDTAIEWAAPNNQVERTIILEALAPIYATDVSGDGTNISPARFVRGLYDNRATSIEPPSTPYSDKLRQALHSRTLVLIASLLHDADVFSSLIEEDAHMRENGKVGAELQKATGNLPNPTSNLWFLETMLQGRATTDTARRFSDAFITFQVGKIKSELKPA